MRCWLITMSLLCFYWRVFTELLFGLVAQVFNYSTVINFPPSSSDEQLTYKKISLCVRSSMKLICYAWLLSTYLASMNIIPGIEWVLIMTDVSYILVHFAFRIYWCSFVVRFLNSRKCDELFFLFAGWLPQVFDLFSSRSLGSQSCNLFNCVLP